MDILFSLNMVGVTILVGVAVTVRMLAAVLAMLLLFRALQERISGGYAVGGFFYRCTEKINAPVRNLMPVGLSRRGMDYSPLVTALFVLFFGLGVGAFLDVLSDGLSTLY